MVSPLRQSFTVSRLNRKTAISNACGASFPKRDKGRRSFYTSNTTNHLRGHRCIDVCKGHPKQRLPRKAKERVTYAKEKMEGENPVNQLGSSLSNKKEKECWTVTCGNKTGVLHLSKLKKAMKCIEYKGQWFTPLTFEIFGGKGSCKKWKMSIFHKNKPLQYWFEEGVLVTKGFNRRALHCLTETTNLPSDSSSEHFSNDIFSTTVNISHPRAAGEPDCPRSDEQSESVTTDIHNTKEGGAESWCEPLDTDTLMGGDREPIDEPSSPAADYPNSSEHGAAGEVELTHSPERGDGELVEIQDAKVPQISADPLAPSNPASDVTDGITTVKLQCTQVENDNKASMTTPEKMAAWDFPKSPSSPSPTADCDLDTMDLNQLKKEKLKMQIKVLRLQQEYYTRKLGPLM